MTRTKLKGLVAAAHTPFTPDGALNLPVIEHQAAQLLATGGLLFFIQSFATLLWSTDHRSVRVSLPTLEVAGIFVSFSRLIAFVLSILAMLALYVFLTRTYTGTAIRAVSSLRFPRRM